MILNPIIMFIEFNILVYVFYSTGVASKRESFTFLKDY